MAGGNTYIRINDKYRLVYDSLCMWIEEYIPKTKKGTARKDPWERVSGYHRTISELMQSLEWREFLMIEDVQSLQELAQAQERLYDEIRSMCESLKTVEQLRQ